MKNNDIKYIEIEVTEDEKHKEIKNIAEKIFEYLQIKASAEGAKGISDLQS